MGRSQRHLRKIQGIDSAGEVDPGSPLAMPAFVGVPTITGTAKVGQTLTGVDPVVTSPLLPYVKTRNWRANGVNIASATGLTYVPVTGDIGKVITLQVTATNAAGTVNVTSAGTVAVIA